MDSKKENVQLLYRIWLRRKQIWNKSETHHKDDEEYVELLEDKAKYEQKKIEIRAREEADKKRKRETDPESLMDWFMVGTVDVLTQNIAKVTNPRDKNRIRGR